MVSEGMSNVGFAVDYSRAEIFVSSDNKKLGRFAERVQNLALVQNEIRGRVFDSKESVDGSLEKLNSSTEFGWDRLGRRFPFRSDKEFVCWQVVASEEDSEVKVAAEAF
jgi:hypothetical protein